MRRVRLGRTGLTVSEVGFGALPIQRLGVEQAVDVLRGAFAAGIDLVDSARAYGDSEAKVGRALEGRAADVVVATKTQARDADGALRDVETSLERLRRRFVHLYQLHAVNDLATLERVLAAGGALEGLERARARGAVLHIGITGHRADVLAAAIRTGRFSTAQVPYNFIEDEPERELFPLARSLDVGVLAMKPIGGGMLPRAALSVKHIRRQPGVVPIPGFESLAEVEELVAAARLGGELDERDRRDIELVKADLGKRFCRRCSYCAPCSQGLNIPQAMILDTLLKRLGVRHFTEGWGKDALEKAETCVRCGECEPRCPYELPIAAVIAEKVLRVRAAVSPPPSR